MGDQLTAKMPHHSSQVSSDLIWEIVGAQNAFLVKRAQSGGVRFSRDPMNLVNKHSRKHAGFVNEKAVGIQAAEGDKGGVTLVTKKQKHTQKPGAAAHKTTFGGNKTTRKTYSSGKMGGDSRVVEYALPDGNKIKIGQERFRAPEILFDPEIIGLEYPGIHQIVVDAINRTDLDLRKSLFGNIVLSGGSTLTKGFGDRLLHEVQRLAVKDMRIKIFAPPERKYSTWIGGSILAGLSTFRKMWVSIDDWHENPDIIHTKFT